LFGFKSKNCHKFNIFLKEMEYKRVLLKLSGESLGGESGTGLDPKMMAQYAEEIAAVAAKGVQVAIVIGGGNIFRGMSGVGKGVSRVKGDQMGMLATVINSIGLSMHIKSQGIEAEVFTSIQMEPIARYYAKEKAVELMERGGVAIIAGGTGNPYFTTDSAAALRACEIEADVLLKGTRVDGVYTADPEKDTTAVKFQDITFDEVYSRGLKIMDLTAFTLCKENKCPIMVFDMDTPGNLQKLIAGEQIGTLVHN
jgi:uridylate kinase